MDADEMKNETIVEDVQLDLVNDELKSEDSNSPKKKRLKSIFVILAIVVLFIAGLFFYYLLNVLKGNVNSDEVEVEFVPATEIRNQDLWQNQILYNAFSIEVPITIEKRTKGSLYNNYLDSLGLQTHDNAIVFTQKGLNNMDSIAMRRYCRIMINYCEGKRGDFLLKDEAIKLDVEDNQIIDEMVKGELGTASLIGLVGRKWVRINNANAIMVSYRRTGASPNFDERVNCKMLLFQNDKRFVKMLLSYREKEADMWADDFEQVLRSFKWIDYYQ